AKEKVWRLESQPSSERPRSALGRTVIMGHPYPRRRVTQHCLGGRGLLEKAPSGALHVTGRQRGAMEATHVDSLEAPAARNRSGALRPRSPSGGGRAEAAALHGGPLRRAGITAARPRRAAPPAARAPARSPARRSRAPLRSRTTTRSWSWSIPTTTRSRSSAPRTTRGSAR